MSQIMCEAMLAHAGDMPFNFASQQTSAL